MRPFKHPSSAARLSYHILWLIASCKPPPDRVKTGENRAKTIDSPRLEW
ncbi:MAG: hypothetical protein LLF96_09680 [Eubacteriales bacterium]|nr:hypothetical protein [Eubacteriales bacterium]